MELTPVASACSSTFPSPCHCTAAGEAQANGALYVRYMKKAVEKGAAWVDTELARLEKLASGASASGAKVQERSVWGRVRGFACDAWRRSCCEDGVHMLETPQSEDEGEGLRLCSSLD